MRMHAFLAGLFFSLTFPAWAADPTVGRLFFTPSQRASLDVARSQRTRVTVATETTQEVVQPVPQTITYGGMIRRSDGRSTVWINNRPVHDGNATEGSPTVVRRVAPDGAVTLEVPQSNRRIDLKVGQSVEVLSGSIADNYEKPAAAPAEKPSSPDAAPATSRESGTGITSAVTDQRKPEPGNSVVPSPPNSR